MKKVFPILIFLLGICIGLLILYYYSAYKDSFVEYKDKSIKLSDDDDNYYLNDRDINLNKSNINIETIENKQLFINEFYSFKYPKELEIESVYYPNTKYEHIVVKSNDLSYEETSIERGFLIEITTNDTQYKDLQTYIENSHIYSEIKDKIRYIQIDKDTSIQYEDVNSIYTMVIRNDKVYSLIYKYPDNRKDSLSIYLDLLNTFKFLD